MKPSLSSVTPSGEAINAIVAVLQEDIVLGRLAPGARLIEEDLAARHQVKRHVVRDAFNELERSGLIERRRNRGAVVRQLLVEDVDKIYAVRTILEEAAIRQMALPPSSAALDAILAAQQAHDAAVARADAPAVFRANFAFHDALFSACGNSWLAAAIEDFRQKTHVVWSYAIVKPEYFDNARDEHHAMIRALKKSDRAKLARLCVAHLDISRRAYVDAQRLRYPDGARPG